MVRKRKLKKQIYVIDTCVLLHDPQCVYKFAEHDIYIPLAVIDDLDDQKTRPGNVGFSAREVFRILDDLNIQDMTSKGVEANDMGGKLFIYNSERPAEGDTPNINRVNSDNAIINAARSLRATNPTREVIIVTKDTGLRVRANSWGCNAENYRSDLLADDTFVGMRYVTLENQKDWDALYSGQKAVAIMDLSENLWVQLENLALNEFVIFCYGEKNKCPTIYRENKLNVLKDFYVSKSGKEKPIEFMGIKPNNLEQRCAMEILADDNIPLVTLCGPAGTGKTLLSLAVALDKINDGIYERIIIIKPIIPVGGKDLGALPGDKWEKLYNWLGPFKDNIEQLMGDRTNKQSDTCFEDMIEDGLIEAEAMAYIQGRSIPRSIIIVDEGQNLTPREARMVVERCGKGSKVILLGDLSQVENPFLDNRSCGLAHSLNGGQDLSSCAAVKLTKVERSELAAIASLIFSRPEAMR